MKTERRPENMLFYGIILLYLVIMLFYLTHSALWYDECVEFYYSKIIKGPVPGGDTVLDVKDSLVDSTNMYQRICMTFQPPLYNVVMYFWLKVSESQWWFRLFGVIVSIVGALGLYKAIKCQTCNNNFSAFCVLLYLLLPSITYYTLECAEYYLMLAFLCWQVYYFVRCLKHLNRYNINMFLLMSVLSVYSQYGAAIQVSSLYLLLLVFTIYSKNIKALKFLALSTTVVIVCAVFPLVFFFTLKQIQNQGVTSTTHLPVFSYGNIIVDLFKSALATLSFYSLYSRSILYLLTSVFFVSLIVSLKTHNRILKMSTIAVIFTWLLYYFLVACNFYGHRVWDQSAIGTINIGERYCIFTIPLFFTVCSVGIYVLYRKFISINPRTGRYKNTFLIIAIVAICCLDVIIINKRDRRNYAIEVTDIWLNHADKSLPTFIHNWQKFQMLYYTTHHPLFNQNDTKNLRFLHNPTTDKIAIAKEIERTKMFENDRFYIIMGKNTNDLAAFLQLLQENGYRCKDIYDSESKLIYVERI